MPRQRKEKKAKDIKLRQPDRTGPSEQTLLQFAEDRDLFKLADKQNRKNKGQDDKAEEDDNDDDNDDDDDDDSALSSSADRLMDTILYAVCLAMLHFTLDFLVQQQYAMEIEYKKIVERAFQALMGSLPTQSFLLQIWIISLMCAFVPLVFAALVHALHPHPANTTFTFIPGLPHKYYNALRQTIFFLMSISCGCYLIHITSRYTYMAVLKQSPPLGCLWIWSVLEMNLPASLLSLATAYLFFWQGGYKL